MNRRKFLSWMAMAPAVAAAAPMLKVLVPIIPAAEASYRTYVMAENAILSGTAGPELNGWVSYKYHMTVTLPPNSKQRIRYIDSTRGVE